MPEVLNGEAECSIELLLRPFASDVQSTILALSSKDCPEEIRLQQYHDDLVIWREWADEPLRSRYTKREVGTVFSSRQTTLVTLTSGSSGTAAYADGRMIGRLPGFPISRSAMTGTLTFGTDPVHMDSWSGELYGLALYGQELSPLQVANNYQSWARGTYGHWIQSPDGLAALFTFREQQRSHVQSPPSTRAGSELTQPPFFERPYKPFLAMPWKQFTTNWEYVNDVLLNILGFITIGFALCDYLPLRGKPHHAILITTLIGGLTSVSVESLQGLLPQRDSSVTDIITNTFGMLIGAWLTRLNPPRKLLASHTFPSSNRSTSPL
jgi:hypothetical protein